MKTSRVERRISSAAFEVAAAVASVLGFAAPADGQETTRVSVDSSGGEANNESDTPSISADGQIVAFRSYANDLVAGDTNVMTDVFVHDRAAGTTERVSVDSSGAQGNGLSQNPSITSDGRIVAFDSVSDNLVAGDGNRVTDVFVHDRGTGVTERMSVDSSGAQGNVDSRYASISAGGQAVAFESIATNLVAGDTNGKNDVFVHDRVTGVTERVSVDSSGAQGNADSFLASISADGRFVAFSSHASNLVAGDTNGSVDVFVHDRMTGITERDSVDSSGAEGNSDSVAPSISADGQVVAFLSQASNLVAGDTNGSWDIFVHDRATGVTERVSVDSSGVEGNDNSFWMSISSDGRIVAFSSSATNLVAGDTNGGDDVFVHDRKTGITERVSVDSSGAQGNGFSSFRPSITPDGEVVAFDSYSSNLVAGDKNKTYDIFVHERCSIDSSWTNYGSGFPGTTGVPSLTSQQAPAFGATVTVDLANSYGGPTSGLLVVGFQRANFHTKYGGQLLVVPAVIAPISFSYGPDSFTATIPLENTLCGLAVDVQGIELDPGAASGLSFSPGLELVIGR